MNTQYGCSKRQREQVNTLALQRFPLLIILAVAASTVLPAHPVQAGPAWQTAPSLPAARSYLATVTGADGTLYAIGGSDSNNVAQSTVYSFKPGTDTAWQTAPPLPLPRTFLAATTGADGTMYAIGGYYGGVQSTVYSFKPGVDSQWQSAPPLPAARFLLAAATGADGTIYAIGGIDSTAVSQTTVYSFKPGTDTQWHTAPSLPAPRGEPVATTGTDGTIYAIGGSESSTSLPTTVYTFKPGTDTQWRTAQSLPAFSFILAAASGKDGTVYVFGGHLGGPLSIVFSFKPGTDTQWQTTKVPALPAVRTQLAAATGADGTLYAIGGDDLSVVPQSAVFSFKPDFTAPTTSIGLSPTQPNGQHGWYTTPVTVRVTAADPDDAAPAITTLCALDPATTPKSLTDLQTATSSCTYAASGGKSVEADGVYTLYAASEDSSGNAEATVRSATFEIDQTPPTIQYSAHPATYATDQDLSITCTARDAVSGVSSSTCAAVSGPAWSYGPGKHSFSAIATDMAGNVGQGATSFTVNTTPANLCALTTQMVHGSSLARALCSVLHGLASATSPEAKSALIEVYDKLVDTEIGKRLTEAQARALKAFAATL